MAKVSPTNEELIRQVRDYVETYMARFDGSHDFHHIKRVVGIAHRIYNELLTSPSSYGAQVSPILDPTTITLGALLHDIGDKKYLLPGQSPNTQVRDLLLSFGATPTLANTVQAICLGVSWSSEMDDPARVVQLITQYPELAIVQDADRLDAIGAVGIGRLFTYGGAKTDRDMHGSVDMMDYKLFALVDTMKTEPGRMMAKTTTDRMRMFRGWWEEEMAVDRTGAKVLGMDSAVTSGKMEDVGGDREVAE